MESKLDFNRFNAKLSSYETMEKEYTEMFAQLEQMKGEIASLRDELVQSYDLTEHLMGQLQYHTETHKVYVQEIHDLRSALQRVLD